ncbi:MAG: hypothetical protein IJ457_06430 [Clostridia bacterium]|nr:hypothetical protein [Clostridia bacterium]
MDSNMNKKAKASPLAQNTITIVILAILAAVCVAMLIGGISSFSEKTIISEADVNYDSIENGSLYSFESMILISEYAYYWEDSEDNPTDHFYIVAFADEDGDVYYASLEVKDSADIMPLCNEYIEYLYSDSEEYMDTLLKGIFLANKLELKESDVRDEYELAFGYCTAELPGTDTRINFTYEAADEAAYRKDARTDAIILTAMGGVLTAICLTALFFTVRRRKQLKADLEKLASASTTPETLPNTEPTEEVSSSWTLNE